MGQNTRKFDFLYYFKSFNKNWGWRAGLLCFIGKLGKYVSGKLEHQLQAAVPVLYWYLFNLSEKRVVKKRSVSSFLVAKMYDVSVYQ